MKSNNQFIIKHIGNTTINKLTTGHWEFRTGEGNTIYVALGHEIAQPNYRIAKFKLESKSLPKTMKFMNLNGKDEDLELELNGTLEIAHLCTIGEYGDFDINEIPYGSSTLAYIIDSEGDLYHNFGSFEIDKENNIATWTIRHFDYYGDVFELAIKYDSITNEAISITDEFLLPGLTKQQEEELENKTVSEIFKSFKEPSKNMRN